MVGLVQLILFKSIKMNEVIKNIKKVIIFGILFTFTPLTYADTNIEFDDKIFIKYFENNNYKITETECPQISEYQKECKMILASKIVGENSKIIDLHIFKDNISANNYFNYVYNDSIDYFKNTTTYNLNNEDNSNYSYIKTELSELYNFYLVRVNNYVIKSNIEINKHKVMDKIYDDLGLIEDDTINNNNSNLCLNLSIVSIISIILDIILIIIIILSVLKIKDYKNKKKILIIEGIFTTIVIIYTILNLIGVFVPDSKKIKFEYESLNNKKTEDNLTYPKSSVAYPNKINYINSDFLVQMIKENKKVAVFIGYPECLYCRSAIGVFVDASNNVTIDKVYYLDINKEDKTSNSYKELLKFLGYTNKNNTEIYVPTVVFIKEQGIVFQNKDTIEKHTDPYLEFNEQFIEGLEEIYLYGFSLLDKD